jgi:CubicO group peptidase (beta-lactamase class C family)/4-amino-4-deoxy-L-arabinose transferase-like glycosyltransferase
MSEHPSPKATTWAWIGLVAILLFDVWWRGHTFGPAVRDALGWQLWPVSGQEGEPLDCDESAYAYMGRRVLRGDALYRDLTENKPPGGYWIYTLAVSIGGANELTIRLLPIPLVLATIALVWWIALRLAGPVAAVLAAGIYAIASTDPYLYGNGANLEHAINLFAVASLALMVARPGRGRAALAGACLGAACLVKQVAITHLPLYVAALLLRGRDEIPGRPVRSRLLDVVAMAAGFAAVWAAAIAALVARGSGAAAYDDIVRYGGALALEAPADPLAPPAWVQWFTGRADPKGNLPWPFGQTDWLVWWGSGTWPLWLAAIPALVWLLRGPADGRRRLVAAWTLSAWVQVALPRLFWQHYYLLPVPGIAAAVAILLADALAAARPSPKGSDRGRARGARAVAAALIAALGWTAVIQVRDYLLVRPQALTERYKGGAQWVAHRSLGRLLARRSVVWPSPRLFVWGWQSPLYIYSGLDSVTSHFFAGPLLKEYAGKDHPLIRPRVERLMGDLRKRPPELIFVGDLPFPALAAFLAERGYLRSRYGPLPPDGPGSRDLRGLWVEPGHYDQFETYSTLSGRGASALSEAPERVEVVRPATPPIEGRGLSGLPASSVARIRQKVSEKMTRRRIPGMSVAVVADGRLRWSAGFGLADVENEVPATAETVYRFASNSKPITAVAVLQLAERGRIDLDAPIQRYVPSYPDKRWPVTPRLLLGHLGGVRHYRGEEVFNLWHYHSIQQALSVFRDDPLVHEPGTKFLYSTYGYNLLGAAVAQASKTGFVGYVRENIFKPAGMAHARADDVAAIIPHRAHGYIRTRSGELRNSALIDPSNRIPGAGFCGTAGDLALFAVALLSDRLLRPETRRLMWQSQLTRDGKPTGYGLGWSVAEHRGHREVSHVGAMPRVSTLLYIRPDDRCAVALMANLEGQATHLLDLAREVADILPTGLEGYATEEAEVAEKKKGD